MSVSSIWLNENINHQSLVQVSINGYADNEDIWSKMFNIEVAFGNLRWDVPRSYEEFKNLHLSLCSYDRSAFRRLVNLFPIHYAPVLDAGTILQRLEKFLVGVVSNVDCTLFSPLYRFLRLSDALSLFFIPSVIGIQKSWRRYAICKKYRTILHQLYGKVRIHEYNKKLATYPRIWILSFASSLIRQPLCNILEVHAQLATLDGMKGTEKESRFLNFLPLLTSTLLMEGNVGSIVFHHSRWIFLQNRVFPSNNDTLYIGKIGNAYHRPDASIFAFTSHLSSPLSNLLSSSSYPVKANRSSSLGKEILSLLLNTIIGEVVDTMIVFEVLLAYIEALDFVELKPKIY